jgi:aspartyl-tRNA(Asn)/glutamyl-tRNA(Gln) amidotransferase subunit A
MDTPFTISEVQNGLISGKFSAVDLVDTYLERINKNNRELNVLLTVTDEKAYETAKSIDKRIRNLRGEALEKMPLLGCVVAFKDIFMTKDTRTTAGSKVLETYIPQYSATVVERLLSAGCIMIGKTNLDAWAHGSSGENSQFGATLNPWNTDYVPGGSSSGSAAALASGFALFATATDTCGSVRLPANYCGVVGLKPTYGAVSRYGIIAMASSLDSVGHHTFTVEDSEKVFDITKGKDVYDSTVGDVNEYKFDSEKKLTIGVPKEFFIGGLDKQVEEQVNEAINTYKKLGAEIKEVSLPSTKYGISVYYIIQPAEVSSNLGRFDGIRYGNDRTHFGDEAKRRIMLGTYVLSAGYYDAYYLRAMKVRSKIIGEVNEVFESVDALIAPVASTPAFKLGSKTEDPLKMYLTDILAATANLSGIPALAIPSCFTKDNLPLGFQLMGPRFSEKLLFHLGKIYQREINYKPRMAIK